MHNKIQRKTALKRLFIKSSFIVITLSLFGCTAVVPKVSTESIKLALKPTSQSPHQTVYVLVINTQNGNNGLHTIEFQGRNKVLMFQSSEDANRFAQKLIRQDFPAPIVEAIEVKEIENFCRTNDYGYELIPQGQEIVPPLDNGEWSSKKNTICNSQRCFPRL